jgi:hypothetical protein
MPEVCLLIDAGADYRWDNLPAASKVAATIPDHLPDLAGDSSRF